MKTGHCKGYDEDQIALVIPDLSNFVAQIPVILGTPTISHIINVMKETEIDALAMPWANAKVAHLLAVHRMTAIMVGDEFMVEPSSDDYDEVVFTQNVETIEAFSSHAMQVPTLVGISMSWLRHYGLKMALCCRVLLYKICTWSWNKVVRMQLWW